VHLEKKMNRLAAYAVLTINRLQVDVTI